MTNSSKGKQSLDWTKHLPAKSDKDKFLKDLAHTLTHDKTIKRLRELLQEEHDKIRQEELSRQAYDNPAWPYLQAHFNGQIRQIERLLKLLETPEIH